MTLRDAPVIFASIRAEGASTSVDVSDRVIALDYDDDEKKADVAKLTIDNWDLSNFDDPVWRKGSILTVSWGYPGDMSPSRECVIQKISGSLQMDVEAQSKAVLLNKLVQNRAYHGLTHSQIVRKISDGYQLPSEIEDTREPIEYVLQGRATDAQFIKRLADQHGFEFYVDWTGLHWHPRKLDKKPIRVLQWYLPPDVGDILGFNVDNDIFSKPGAVRATVRDPLTKKTTQVVGSDAATERPALNPVVEIVDALTGVSRFSERSANEDVRPTSAATPQQAKKEVDGAYRRSVQSTVKLDLELVGDPGIVAKSVVEVRGLGKRLSGLYYVNSAQHSVSSSGYRLRLKCSTDGTRAHIETIAGSTLLPTRPTSPSKASVTTAQVGGPKPDNSELSPVEVVDRFGATSIEYRKKT